MNEGLKALENIKIDMEYVTRLDFVEPIVRGQVQQELYKIYHRETSELATIEKELKEGEKNKQVLEIIINKDVDVVSLKLSINLKQYNCKEDGRCPLTQEEYDLLKEVLLCQK